MFYGSNCAIAANMGTIQQTVQFVLKPTTSTTNICINTTSSHATTIDHIVSPHSRAHICHVIRGTVPACTREVHTEDIVCNIVRWADMMSSPTPVAKAPESDDGFSREHEEDEQELPEVVDKE